MSSLTRGLRRCTIIGLVAGTAALAAPTAALAAPAPAPAKALAASPAAAQTAHTEAFGQGCLLVLTQLFGPTGDFWHIAATDPAAVLSTLYAWLVANPAGPTVTQLCLSGE